MPECRDCGKTERLHWGKTKDGRPVLLESVPHFVRCAKRSKKQRAEDELVFSRDISEDEQAALRRAIEEAK